MRRRRKQPRGEEAGAGAEPLGGGGGEGLAERRGGRGVDGSVGVATREDPGARDAGGGGEEERGAAAAAEEHSGRIAGRWAGSAVAHTRRGESRQEEHWSRSREASCGKGEEKEENGPLFLEVAGLYSIGLFSFVLCFVSVA